ncbi:hypothetical protein ACLBWT_21560 [Paenibacillus sp. D51F]
MNRNVNYAAASLLTLVLAAGCGADQEAPRSRQPASESTVQLAASPPAGAASPRPTAPGPSPDAPAASESLFPDGIMPDYDGSGRSFMVDGQETQTKLLSDSLTPIAVFVPVALEEFEEGKGKAWGTSDHRNHLLFRSGSMALKTSEQDPLWIKYKEYKGTVRDRETSVDYFAFTAHGKPYTAEIRTAIEYRERMLPIFTKMLENAQFLEKKKLPKPGVYVTRPQLSGKGTEQMTDAVMDFLNGWATGDRKLFSSSLYSPQTAEAFDFLLYADIQYRFDFLSYEGQPADTKRIDYAFTYQAIHSNGYLTMGSGLISLLKNKQGEWKVATID